MISKCLLCNKKETSTNVAENLAFGKKFYVAFCYDCELYYFTKLPPQNLIENYYSGQSCKRIKESRYPFIVRSWFSKIRAISQYKFIKCNMDSDKKKSILEIGSAFGIFLSFFKRNGWKIRGLELDDNKIKQARKMYNIQLEKNSVFDINPNEGKFDVIAFSHVLEHLPNPIETINHCKELLKSDGFIFIELPHLGLPKEFDLNEYYKTNTHIYNYRVKSLVKLIRKSNLRIRKMNRFFFRVPIIFANRYRIVGRTLIRGKLFSLSIINIGIVLISIFNIFLHYLFNLDPMKKIKLSAKWHGLGDNLRVIASKN